MNRAQRGFTLIEIAIVLVIIGLLLGGVLKGSELIKAARVRELIAQQDGIKAAFFGFQDRYRALPGDYAAAAANIQCSEACPNGNGNGRIEDNNAPSLEYIYAWTHLTAARFMNGSYAFATGESTASPTNTPKNPYGAYIKLSHDAEYGFPGASTISTRHNLKTGHQVPAEILAEVDRKVDDGRPYSGSFQFTMSDVDDFAVCVLGEENNAWDIVSHTSDCAGASLF